MVHVKSVFAFLMRDSKVQVQGEVCKSIKQYAIVWKGCKSQKI